MKKVAVEKSLGNIKSSLEKEGYGVVDLESVRSNLNDFDAIVVSGQNSNFLGIHNTNTKASVINAKGLSVEDVKKQLTNRLS